ncbi:MAG TPA: hypothetical protein VGM54_14990 [Chthoniobacter sp.]|jgi:hypothetical protein
MKIRRYFSVLILSASVASALAGDGQSMGSTSLEIDPTQLVHSLPGQLTKALPGQVVGPLPGEVVQSLPGQMVQSLPGELTRALPGQVVQSLPGQLVRSLPYRPSHSFSGPVALHVQLTLAVTTSAHSKK